MIKNPLAACILAGACLGAAFPALADAPKDVLDVFHAALTAGDKNRVLGLMAPEVVIYESGYVERSRAEYAHHHLAGDMAFAKTSTRKVLKQSEKMEGNLALIWQETETTGTSRGKLVHVIGTETALLEKKGDTWAIIHVHWSSRKAK